MQRNSLDHLMILRFGACLMVVVHHCMMPWGNCPVRVLFADGPAAVWCFFTLSGYLMGKGFYSGRYDADLSGAHRFLFNRAVRILPLVWLFVLPAATSQLFQSPTLIERWFHLARSLVLAISIKEISNLSGPLWSVGVEWRFYLLMPLIFWACLRAKLNRRSAQLCLLAIIILGEAAQFQGYRSAGMNHWVWDIYISFFYNLNCFLAGVILNFIMPDKPIDSVRNLRLGYYMVLVWYLVSAFNVGRPDEHLVHAMIIQPLTILVTLAFIFICDSDRPPNRSFSLEACRENRWRWLEWGGVLTYGIYLFHLLIMEHTKEWFIPINNYAPLFLFIATTLLLSIVASLIGYFCIERPLQRFRQ